jgi:NACalpha-BTF3-like transcription factor
MNQWKSIYSYILSKFSLTANNKRLILKNPVNTGRAALLHSMFPGSAFVFIHRNPYEVFLSTRNLYRKVMPLCQLQSISDQEVDHFILKNYSRQLEQYFIDREKIPSAQLIELRYKDLELEPMVTLERIYKELDLNGFEQASQHFSEYLESQKNYKKNEFQITEDDIRLVNSVCASIFEKLGYTMVEAVSE